jgi:hypothetical protein
MMDVCWNYHEDAHISVYFWIDWHLFQVVGLVRVLQMRLQNLEWCLVTCARSPNTRCSEALFRRNYPNPGCEFAQPEWIDTEVHGLYPLLHLQVLLWEDASSPITRFNRFVPSTGMFGWELDPQNPNDHGWPSDHGADFARSPLGVWHLWYHVVLWACPKWRPFRKTILHFSILRTSLYFMIRWN